MKRGIITLLILIVIPLAYGCSNKDSGTSVSPTKTAEVIATSTPTPAITTSPTASPNLGVEPTPVISPTPTPAPTQTPVPTPTLAPTPSAATESTPKPSPAQGNVYKYGNYVLTDNNLSNSSIGWYFKRSTEFQRMPAAKSEEWLKQYDSYYIGENRKVIYLTFDEGQDQTYAAQNLDTLKKHGVKAVFFVTKPYIKLHGNLVKRMVDEGHVVGNHTDKHLEMPTLASADNIQSYIKEIADTEDAYKTLTGKDIEKIFRYPKGSFSEKTLSFNKDLGYRTYFWSFAYDDWEENTHSRESSLNWMKKYYHPGALYLLHGVSKGNSEALDEFITFMKEQGYSFDTANNIK